MDIAKLSLQIKQEKDILEKSRLIIKAIKDNNLKISELSKIISIKPAYICHLIRLQTLPDIVIDGYYSKLISPSHLLVVSRVKDKKKVVEIYEKILINNLSVSSTEDLVRECLYMVKNEGKYLPKSEVEKFKQNFEKQGGRVKLIQTRIKAKIIIEFKGGLSSTSQKLRDIIRKING